MPTPIFIKSAAAPADFPPDDGREVAFVGRSNSGKSTALNLLAGVRKLARVSKTPGRTQLVNFFGVGEERRLVDLPGYGFARVVPGTQERWRELIETYLTTRRSLVGLIVTIDIRRGITDLDDALLHWLEPLGLHVGLLLTKADKLGHGAGIAREREIAASVAQRVELTRFSALNRTGVDVARGWIDSWMRRDAHAATAADVESSESAPRK
ncbi:MAG TPA: ribosome biogenesis GTP-binding protein YihA/YsxC [Gammaproteobacteria bacterium]|nr:ribosome biogenesis GTP-binding protein YihA/YsxC [Gammaproteobacteria bacterium]